MNWYLITMIVAGLIMLALGLLQINDPWLPVRNAWRYIMCDVLGWHDARIVAVGYSKVRGFSANDKRMRKAIVRTRLMFCDRCCHSLSVEDWAEVSSDYSYPERLFNEGGSLNPMIDLIVVWESESVRTEVLQ